MVVVLRMHFRHRVRPIHIDGLTAVQQEGKQNDQDKHQSSPGIEGTSPKNSLLLGSEFTFRFFLFHSSFYYTWKVMQG